METTQSTATDSQTAPPALTPKPTKRRIKKLTAAEVAGLPGVTHAPEPVVQSDLKYFLCFLLPVSGPVGTLAEAGQILDFVYRLNTYSTEKDVGVVTAVGLSNGQAEIVLKLNVMEKPESNGVPVSNAFSQLKEYLDGAAILKSGPAGKPAVWKAKVNGTTIVEGHY
ncbi:hypothetical protein [Dechloromonas sp. H13]|uniref:hypothetical protein n=1 Tax=Dechloromonas sp. H13 TaxID=2570193 RepID=UPI0012910082|nr:hypothetical protein [Dechloromonas sp. H13]